MLSNSLTENENTVFPHKFWRPFLDCMPRLFFRPQYVWFPVHLKGLLIPLWYETLVVNWQNWLFTLFRQSRSVLSTNPIEYCSHDSVTYIPYVTRWRDKYDAWATYIKYRIVTIRSARRYDTIEGASIPCYLRITGALIVCYSWWRHQMETFPRYWPFVRGSPRSPVNSPHKGQWRGALMFSLICVWINGLVNNRQAGDLIR